MTDIPEFTAYAVGKPFVPGRTEWPDCLQVRLSPRGSDLAVFFTRPSPIEKFAFTQGEVEFAWIDSEHTGVLCVRFGDGIPWHEAIFTPHRQTTLEPGLAEGNGHLLMSLFLVDASTGILQGIRLITWPPKFVAAVRESVERMKATPFSQQAADDAYAVMTQRYDTPAKLVNKRANIRCIAGGPELVTPPAEDA